MEIKSLHKNISEEEILFALVAEEVGEACILSQVIKVIINSGGSQERFTRPFARPNLRSARKIVFGIFILLILLILRASARGAPQQSLYHFLPRRTIAQNSFVNVALSKEIENGSKMS